jgi:hypothetical protein
MCRSALFALLLLYGTAPVWAQAPGEAAARWSFSGQYGGSIGTVAIGAIRHARNERIGVGLFYGRTPHHQGGPINAYTAKFMYTPWQVRLKGKWYLEPLQTGAFVSYSTGQDLSSHWPGHLDPGYYWWTNNFRQHLFLRTQLSRQVALGRVERIGAWFEVNTNDLYVYSWWPNRAALSVYDILFFGAGVQVYLRPSEATGHRSCWRPCSRRQKDEGP